MKIAAKYYVYAHRDGLGRIFYIGKGKGRRAYAITRRSQRWQRHSSKYGHSVEFVCADMPEPCAFALERIIIGIIGRGNLCNLTDGGEGTSGRVPTTEQKMKCSKSNKGKKPAKHAIQKAVEKTRKMVGTTCGLVFESITAAAKFAAIDGNVNAAKSSISSCCRGHRISQCYGYEFRYMKNGVLLDSGFREKKVGRAVANDAGNSFETILSAEKWLRENGHPKALASNISQSCILEKRNAYGFKWRYL
jgi:hypothetical protein